MAPGVPGVPLEGGSCTILQWWKATQRGNAAPGSKGVGSSLAPPRLTAKEIGKLADAPSATLGAVWASEATGFVETPRNMRRKSELDSMRSPPGSGALVEGAAGGAAGTGVETAGTGVDAGG
eukprot:scaffold58999_cov30-Tisochrysis_lutea.AAC.3